MQSRALRGLTGILAAALTAAFAAGAGTVRAHATTPAESAAADPLVAEPGELLVVFQPVIVPEARESFNRQVGATILRRIDSLAADLVKLPPGMTVAQAEQAYAASGLVRYSQPNYVRRSSGTTPDDDLFGLQWAMRNTGQSVGVPEKTVSGTPDDDVDLSEPSGTPDAWDQTTGSPDVVVAVIDGGIRIDHPDLAPNIWTNPGEVPGNGVDDDGNGYVDDVHGWDFTSSGNGDPFVSSFDRSSGNPSDRCDTSALPPGTSFDDHGTHVSGIIGAVGDNGIGVAGVAWRVRIMPLKFLSCERGDDAAAVAAVEYAIRMKADVINASWGGTGGSLLGGPPRALGEALARAGRAGITVVAASGNGGRDRTGDDLARRPDYPASFDLPNEIVVTATDPSDRLLSFANFGGPTALSAPGEMIVSTLAGSPYGYLDGTSMAAPFVSGAIALMRSRRPGLSPEEIKSTILATVDKVPELAPPVTRSGGRLNVAGALGRSAATPVGVAACTGSACAANGAGAAAVQQVSAATTGYRLVAADGGIFSFGDVPFLGSTGDMRLAQPIVAMASTPSGRGYWTAAADGGIFAFGDAVFSGSTGTLKLARPIVGMAPTPSGQGYWLVASDGGIFAFGDAVFRGSTGDMRLARAIVAMASTPSGQGYWLVASDGGIFAFGDAAFFGSTGALKLAQPIVAMARTPSGRGYWFVASDGGIFAFGDAPFRGSAGAVHLRQPIVGMSAGV